MFYMPNIGYGKAIIPLCQEAWCLVLIVTYANNIGPKDGENVP